MKVGKDEEKKEVCGQTSTTACASDHFCSVQWVVLVVRFHCVIQTTVRRWGYLDDAQSVDCDCGEPQMMAHLLSCRLLDEACTADDLATGTERAKACARKWENSV